MVNYEILAEQMAKNPLATAQLQQIAVKMVHYLESNEEYPNDREREWFMRYIAEHGLFVGTDELLKDVQNLLKALA